MTLFATGKMITYKQVTDYLLLNLQIGIISFYHMVKTTLPWSVAVKDKTKTEYGEILSEIAGKPMTNMLWAFVDCESLATAPAIPNSVTNMFYTFNGCTSLTTAPVIPNSVTDMYSTFSGCTSLTTAPEIPDSVTNMSSTFYSCTSLTTAPVIPNGVTYMSRTFYNCTSLTGTIEINANPTEYKFCFSNTSKPIVLTGSSTMLSQIARGRSNITIQQ